MRQIEWRPIGDVRPYERNPRRNEKAVDKVAASIREFGWQQPIVVDEDGVILAGHTRRLAAETLGIEQVPVVVAEGLTDAQRAAYRLADNRLSEYATWDEELLRSELRDLAATDLDLALTGFSVGQIRRYTDDIPEEGESAVADSPKRCSRGDLWLLGIHRLLVGDSTSKDHVALLFDGARPNLMVTDPPYGVDYDPSWRSTAMKQKTARREKIAGDRRVDWTEAWDLFPGAVAYVWHAGIYCGEVANNLIAAKLIPRAQIVWIKPHAVLSRGHYHQAHEPCLYAERDHELACYAVKKGENAKWGGSRLETTVWEVDRDKFDSAHPTQKPVECMLRAIRNHEIRDVYDPFVGTGTTIIAAEHEGRRCFAMEKVPKWADVAIHRWEQLTGRKAEKADGGAQAETDAA